MHSYCSLGSWLYLIGSITQHAPSPPTCQSVHNHTVKKKPNDHGNRCLGPSGAPLSRMIGFAARAGFVSIRRLESCCRLPHLTVVRVRTRLGAVTPRLRPRCQNALSTRPSFTEVSSDIDEKGESALSRSQLCRVSSLISMRTSCVRSTKGERKTLSADTMPASWYVNVHFRQI